MKPMPSTSYKLKRRPCAILCNNQSNIISVKKCKNVQFLFSYHIPTFLGYKTRATSWLSNKQSSITLLIQLKLVISATIISKNTAKHSNKWQPCISNHLGKQSSQEMVLKLIQNGQVITNHMYFRLWRYFFMTLYCRKVNTRENITKMPEKTYKLVNEYFSLDSATMISIPQLFYFTISLTNY